MAGIARHDPHRLVARVTATAMLTSGGIIIAAGLFTFWRERVQARATGRNTGRKAG